MLFKSRFWSNPKFLVGDALSSLLSDLTDIFHVCPSAMCSDGRDGRQLSGMEREHIKALFPSVFIVKFAKWCTAANRNSGKKMAAKMQDFNQLLDKFNNLVVADIGMP